MRTLLRRVPHLNRLAVLDAVAVAGDFTSAARAQEISQPAVSRHMAALARELGMELFERRGRSLVLTPAGRHVAEAVQQAFAGLEQSLAKLHDGKESIVFAGQPAMATSWVVPLLDQLETAADCEVRLRIFERSAELDLTEWHIAIVPGAGDFPVGKPRCCSERRCAPSPPPALQRNSISPRRHHRVRWCRTTCSISTRSAGRT